MKEFLEYFEYARVYIVIALGVIAITFILHFLFTKYKYVKYVPGIILIPIGLYGLTGISSSTELLEGVGKFMIFIIGIGGGSIGLLTALMIGVFYKDKK